MTAASVRLAILTLAGLVVGALTAVAILPQARERLFPRPNVTSWGQALIGGPFALTDHTGRRVTDSSFRGRTMLVVFGYTSCPDLCASVLQVLSAALDKLGPQADRFVPVLITADPERDTPERLDHYVQGFHPRLVGLTGTPAEIADVLKAYRIRTIRESKGPAAQGAVDQRTLIHVMGPDGGFRTVLNYTSGAGAIAARLAAM